MEINKANKTAILYGATGMVGKEVLDILLSHPNYNTVKVFGRRSCGRKHPKLQEFIIDFDKLVDTAYDTMVGHDLYLCLGTTMAKAKTKEQFYRVDYKFQYIAAQIAKKQGADQVILISATDASRDSRIFYNRVKGETEDAIADIGFWGCHIARPAMLLGNRSDYRPIEFLVQKVSRGAKFLLGSALGEYEPITAKRLAKALVNTAQSLKPGTNYYASHELNKLGL